MYKSTIALLLSLFAYLALGMISFFFFSSSPLYECIQFIHIINICFLQKKGFIHIYIFFFAGQNINSIVSYQSTTYAFDGLADYLDDGTGFVPHAYEITNGAQTNKFTLPLTNQGAIPCTSLDSLAFLSILSLFSRFSLFSYSRNRSRESKKKKN
jgi:hypothetical protein